MYRDCRVKPGNDAERQCAGQKAWRVGRYFKSFGLTGQNSPVCLSSTDSSPAATPK
jgi:hypothetical protein